jgi:hypothetical protein
LVFNFIHRLNQILLIKQQFKYKITARLFLQFLYLDNTFGV